MLSKRKQFKRKVDIKRKSFRSGGKLFARKKNIPTISKKKILAVLFIVLLLYFPFCGHFSIDRINIKGNQNISTESIDDVTREKLQQLIFGFIPKDNFFLIESDDIELALAERFSEIESISVYKKLPNSIEIEIIEKNPELIWCRADNCYYLDNNGVAFLVAKSSYKRNAEKKFIKIVEELKIDEEKNLKNIEDRENKDKEKENFDNNNEKEDGDKQTVKIEEENKKTLDLIRIGDKVSDAEFISFAINIDREIKKNTKLKVKYYKTGGTQTRELIAYTDKNTGLYFDAISDAKPQIEFLNDFLRQMGDKKIETMEYIYLKTGNKIFYK